MKYAKLNSICRITIENVWEIMNYLKTNELNYLKIKWIELSEQQMNWIPNLISWKSVVWNLRVDIPNWLFENLRVDIPTILIWIKLIYKNWSLAAFVWIQNTVRSNNRTIKYKNFDILAVLKKQRPLLSQIREQYNSDLNKPKAENRDPELKFQRCCKYVEGVVARRQWI